MSSNRKDPSLEEGVRNGQTVLMLSQGLRLGRRKKLTFWEKEVS